ncbi:MAG: hypothetical protein JJLCMIEE_00505 [Acidimicrobiales bacterium]|nr:MAG: ABC transporter permease [Actinomycetota bacterium]MBV6507457.1 hypothetical protein [Acidimicrobiales bacterium]RIK07837.1 MAG: ABC transporter [Acidobacteriota bacterium]
MSAYLAQVRTELTLTLRQGEQMLVSVVIPVMLLVFFSMVEVLPTGTTDPVDFLAPAILALAVMSSAMVSLGISTGFERQYLVLKRLGTTPLGRPRLVAAKASTVVCIEAVQFAVLIPVAYLLGWSPDSTGWPSAAAGVLLGTLAFAGLGLLLAGTLPGTVTLGLANGLWLLFLLTGGMVFPLSELPDWLAALSRLLPAAALSEVVVGSLKAGAEVAGRAWIVLVIWAVALPAAAAACFRWE